MQQASLPDKHCAVCRPAEPWKNRTETCCAEHQKILEIAKTIRKGTATGQWGPEGPEQAKERWCNRSRRVRDESDYRRHWLHCIVAQNGKCGDPQKDPTGKGCGRNLLALPAVSIHVDHIVPRSKGGRDGWENCQALCSDCNLRAGDGSRDDSPIRIAQRIWEAMKSPEIVRQAREQKGRCTGCGNWLWSKEPTKVWFVGQNGHLACDQCGNASQRKWLAERDKIERARVTRIGEEIDNYVERKWEGLEWSVGIICALPLSVVYLAVMSAFMKTEVGAALFVPFVLLLTAAMLCFRSRVKKKFVSRWRERESQSRLCFNPCGNDVSAQPTGAAGEKLLSNLSMRIDQANCQPQQRSSRDS